MAKHTISLTLDSNSINDAINKVNDYNNSLFVKMDLLASRLADLGVSIAQAKIVDYFAIETGQLFNSLRKEMVASGIYLIIADNEYAKYVEFGTGTMGAKSSYQYPLPSGVNWQYNVGRTIHCLEKDIVFENGSTLRKGELVWYYPGRDGKWHITQGMPSRPFMYETSLDLQKRIVEVAKVVFG